MKKKKKESGNQTVIGNWINLKFPNKIKKSKKDYTRKKKHKNKED